MPLVYFIGVRRGTYFPVYPIFIVGEDSNRSEVSRSDSSTRALEKRYVLRETRARLHQPIFREQVMNAYGSSCAVCRLAHTELLDAAHIIDDSKPHGDPVVPNGIALCKIHHAAFDQNMMGIREDFRVVISPRLLHEVDGPMLKHGLQEMHGSRINLPRRVAAHPDKDRLEERFSEFLNAS